jgi:hypothetical protein
LRVMFRRYLRETSSVAPVPSKTCSTSAQVDVYYVLGFRADRFAYRFDRIAGEVLGRNPE